MAGKNLTIKLTDDQQQQIKAATGKSLTELSFDVAGTGQLSDADLDRVTGGDESPKETVTFEYGALNISYKPQS